jgi:putative phosphoesterase
MMRIAVLSDIHGNRWALEAALSDIRKRGVDQLVNLGDIVYGPLDPEATARLLIGLDIPSTTILGNEDRVLFESNADTTPHSSLEFTRSELSTSSFEWLRRLPSRDDVDDVLLIHGTPEDDEEYLLEKVDTRGSFRRRPEEVGVFLKGLKARLVLCGHSHLARCVQVPDGPLVVNPGSIGLPAYFDDDPYSHRMEAGSPHARYAIVERVRAGWNVELIVLAYDWGAAAQKADRHGRPDWAVALRTGFAGIE